MGWDEIQVSTWEEFREAIETFDYALGVRNPYIYRGQSDSSFQLTTRLWRAFENKENTSRDNFHEFEKWSLGEFEADSHHFLSESILRSCSDCTGWWSLMQHFGAPTRLLDWTLSPYVACYFAARENFDKPGTIWVVQHDILKDATDKIFPTEKNIPDDPIECIKYFCRNDSPDVLIAVKRHIRFERIKAQQGVFTVCLNVHAKHDEVIRKIFSESDNPNYLAKIIIPADLKLEAIKRLRSMNITASTLFPGLEGLARSLEESILIP